MRKRVLPSVPEGLEGRHIRAVLEVRQDPVYRVDRSLRARPTTSALYTEL